MVLVLGNLSIQPPNGGQPVLPSMGATLSRGDTKAHKRVMATRWGTRHSSGNRCDGVTGFLVSTETALAYPPRADGWCVRGKAAGAASAGAPDHAVRVGPGNQRPRGDRMGSG